VDFIFTVKDYSMVHTLFSLITHFIYHLVLRYINKYWEQISPQGH